jgi:hypothetical protein
VGSVAMQVVLVRSDRAAVVLSNFGATPNGISFHASIRMREQLNARRRVAGPMHFF